MQRALSVLVLLGGILASGYSLETLDPGTELTFSPPWSDPVALASLLEGHYRLEATTLSGDPVEMIVEKHSAGGWVSAGTNRTLRGALEAGVDLNVGAAEAWRVRPVRTEPTTVILKLRKAAFAELRDTLKQDLTPGPTLAIPLHQRIELPPGTGGSGLAAAVGQGGSVWVGWLTDGGWGAEVWDAVRGRRVGAPLKAVTAPWTSLSLTGASGLVASLEGPDKPRSLAWNGSTWAREAAPSPGLMTTPWGTFRTETKPEVKVFRSRPAGWEDLALPRDAAANLILLGSTDDGLAAFLASSTTAHRGFYRWKPNIGWVALPPPPAAGPPWGDLWAVTAGAGVLYHLEGNDTELNLRAFDGAEWRPALDLMALAPKGVRAAVLLPPSAWSKTGTLVLASDRVAVYDLP